MSKGRGDGNLESRTRDGETLARTLGGRLVGENRRISALVAPSQLADAATPEGAVVVLESRTQLSQVSKTLGQLGAVVVPARLETVAALPCPVIYVPDTRAAFARLTAMFAPPPPEARISEHAVVGPGVTLAAGVSIGVGAVVAESVRLGAGCRVGAGCVLGAGCMLGEDTVLHANVTLYPGVRLGARVILHSGVVVGADGFGYAFTKTGALKIHHLGTVVIGDDVEVGANSCIDRATLGETRIGARSKIDNLCQIGHNVVMEPDCVVAGSSAIGGSTVLERGVVLGGAVALKDHLRLGAGARIAGRSSVTKNVPAGESWGGYPAQPQRRWARERYLLGQLDALWLRLKKNGVQARTVDKVADQIPAETPGEAAVTGD